MGPASVRWRALRRWRARLSGPWKEPHPCPTVKPVAKPPRRAEERQWQYRDRLGRQIARAALARNHRGAGGRRRRLPAQLLADPEPGVYFTAQPNALRAGVGFGAFQPRQCFKTEAERDAYAVKYFRNAEKAAAKREGR